MKWKVENFEKKEDKRLLNRENYLDKSGIYRIKFISFSLLLLKE